MTAKTFDRLDGFDEVDQAAENERLLAFLAWVDAKPDVIARRARSYELLRLRPGTSVADIGCGLGTVLGELLDAGVAAVGVDASEAMVEEASRRVPGATVHLADAAALPLADRTLTGYRAERVYQHIADPQPALAEALRVLEPGGRIVLVDQDWDAFVVDGDERATTRAVLRAFGDSIANPWAGRRNGIALAAAGFIDVQVEAETVTDIDYEYARPFLPAVAAAAVGSGEVEQGAADAWLAEQQRRGESGGFFAAMTHFLTSATKAA